MMLVADRHTDLRQAESPAAPIDRRGEMLVSILTALDDATIRYCIPQGHERLPGEIRGDVDLIVDPAALPGKLAAILESKSEFIGGEVIQWLADGAHLITLVDKRQPGAPQLLQLHVNGHYELANRVFFSGEEMLKRRRRVGGLWIPEADMEFGCILANKVSKGRLADDRAARLTELYKQSPLACEHQMSRLFRMEDALLIGRCAESGDWTGAQQALPQLREQLLRRAAHGDALGMLRRNIAGWGRRIQRWIRPQCGLHVVFLGPDGVGKSTILSAVQDDLSPAFLKTEYRTFAPSLLPAHMQQKPSPHALPPRGYFASLLKAAWWLVCYTLGYFATIYPARARSAFVLNHRYLLDAVVDRRRYRYSGPIWLLKLIGIVSPKADLVILLYAPAEVIQKRKQEVAFEETERQLREYRAVVESLANGHVIDASVAINDTTRAVEKVILDFLRARIVRRFVRA